MKMRTLNEAVEDLKDLNVTRDKLRRGILAGKYPYLSWGNRYLVDVELLRPILQKEAAARNTIGITECAEQLGLSVDALRRMTRSGMIPYERKGRYYKYRVADVEAALRDRMEKMR